VERSEALEIRGTIDVPDPAQRAPSVSQGEQPFCRLRVNAAFAPGDALEQPARNASRADERVTPVLRGRQHDVAAAAQQPRRAPQVLRPQDGTIRADEQRRGIAPQRRRQRPGDERGRLRQLLEQLCRQAGLDRSNFRRVLKKADFRKKTSGT